MARRRITNRAAMAVILKALKATRPGHETMTNREAMRAVLKALDETRPGHGEIVGRRVRALREEAGLSQRALAKRAGLSATYVARLEPRKGRRAPSLNPSRVAIGRLAKALDVPVGELLE